MTKKQTKTKKPRLLEIKDVLNAIDNRNYNFYDSLSDDQKKEFNPYILMRFVSNVSGNNDLQEYYLEMTSELINKNHWLFSKEDKSLLWKLFASLGIGQTLFHPYLPSLKLELNKIEKLIGELYPAMKIEDIKFLASLMTEEDKNELFEKMGFDKQQRKEYE